MNIIVLCGGISPERDVSLTSGSVVASALRRRGHRAVLMDLFFGYREKYDDPAEIFERPYDDSISKVGEDAPDIEAVKRSRVQDDDSRIGDNVIEVCRAADIVFMALHGEDGENGKIQALFDIMGIKYTGCGYLGSAMAMNKGVAKKMFRENGILTPEGYVLKRTDEVFPNPGYPCVVKPCSGGSSVGTSIARNDDEYMAALKLAFKYDTEVVSELYIKGRECDVGVIAGKALPVIEICPKTGFYDYKNKYQSGLTDEYCPADLPDDVTLKLQRAAEAVFGALHLDVYARMDFMVDQKGDVYCLEANTLPGMTPMSLLPQEAAAVGISYEELCELIVHESLKKYN
ncbi:MAG: D-alanine--D-alanine ligase [Oscillospiraceae bacterium]|nr:D-alanine--D-alanine ligase [Oscillospiraceae bacterium]